MRAALLTVGGVASLLLVAAAEEPRWYKRVRDNENNIKGLEKQLADLQTSIDNRIAEEVDHQVRLAVEARFDQLGITEQIELIESRKEDLDERYASALELAGQTAGALARLGDRIKLAHAGVQLPELAVASFPELRPGEAEQQLGDHKACFLVSVKTRPKPPFKEPDCSIHRRGKRWVLEAHHGACSAACLDLVLPDVPASDLLDTPIPK